MADKTNITDTKLVESHDRGSHEWARRKAEADAQRQAKPTKTPPPVEPTQPPMEQVVTP